MSGVFKLHQLRVCLIGAITGLALAMPVAAGDWSSSFLTGTAGPTGYQGAGSYVSRSALEVAGPSGMQAAFDHDYGEFVLGGTVRQGGGLDITGLGGAVDSQQLHLRAGYDFGRTLGYVTLGELQHGATADAARSQVFGVGLRVSVNRVLQMTGEWLHHEVGAGQDLVGSGGDVLAVRAAFRF